MKSTSSSTPAILTLTGAITTMAILSTGLANADIESHASALTACISENVKIESEKPEPDVDLVFKRCQDAYKKLIAQLPEGSENMVYDNVNKGIRAQLKVK